MTEAELGKVLLGKHFQCVTQRYLDYYAQGPTSPTTCGGYHPGIDYRALTALQVYSPINGSVASIGPLGRISLQIEQSDDYWICLHLSRIDVQEYQSIAIGDQLGLTGSVGTAHPHLELRTGKQRVAYYFTKLDQVGCNKNPLLICQPRD